MLLYLLDKNISHDKINDFFDFILEKDDKSNEDIEEVINRFAELADIKI